MSEISVIIPAHNEAGYIASCLEAVLASRKLDAVQIIVVANACSDQTVAVAAGYQGQASEKGWDLQIIDTTEPGKLAALNRAEQTATGEILAYLDADVEVSPLLLKEVMDVLKAMTPRYASGTPVVSARSGFARAYARFWSQLPFVASGVPGFGFFAVNSEGRKRWSAFPAVISDDTFVRLHFAPHERYMVSASYRWPMIEGFANLVRVRRRQDRGVEEICRLYPAMLENQDAQRVAPSALVGIALRDLAGFFAYACVKLTVKTPLFRGTGWVRGR